jgi:hypothetical protein
MDSFQHNRCSCSNVLNQNLNLKFYHMSFLFELFDIHLNEQITTCHKCNDFKWDIYIYNFAWFCFNLMSILAHQIVTTP